MANEFRVKNGLIVSNGDITHEDGNFSYTSASELLEVTYLKTNVIIEVENASSTDVLYKGMPVYVSAIGTGKPQVSKAEADDSTKMPSVGIVVADISASGSGYITTGGTLNGLDGDADATNPIVDVDVTTGDIGKVLYVSETAGVLTLTRPTAAASSVQNVGVITDVTGSAGSVIFKMKVSNIGRANDTPNKISIEGDIYTQGNVGIGTTSPTFTSGGGLHIKDSSQANVRLEENTGEYFDLSMLNGDAYLINRVSDGFMKFRTNNTDRMTILSGGDIGIGTTIPDTSLHVSDGEQVTLSVDSSNSIGAQISLYSTATGGDEWRLVSAADGASADAGAFGLYNIDTTAYRLVVKADGNVGIGTTSPTPILHVKADNSITDMNSAGAAGITIEQDGTGDAAFSMLLSATRRWMMGIDNSDSDKLKFATGGTSVDSGTALTIDTSGNVGIGTSSPAVNLDVRHSTTSKIRAQGASNFATTLVATSGGTHIAIGDIDSSEESFMKIGAYNSINNIDTKNRDLHIFGTNTTTGFYFDESAGMFGIGTTSPGDLLELESTNAVMRLDASASGSGVAWVKFDDQGTSKWALGISKNGLSGSDFHIYEDASSGSPRVTVKDGGNVGIGTTSPSFASGGGLEIENATQANLRVTDSTASASSDFGQSENDLYIVNRKTNGDIKIRVNSSNELMTFDGQNQRVGIGTTSPDALLHVDTGSDTGTAIIADGDIIVRRQSDNTNGIRLNAENNVGTHADILFHESAVIAAGNDMYFAIDSDASTTDAFFQWRKDGDQSDTGSPLMTLGESGDLGLGTTSPDGRLHVVDGNHQILTLERTVNNTNYGSGIHFQLGDSASTTAGHNYAAIYGHIEDGTDGSEDGFFSIHTSNAGTLAEKVRVESNGNVGIGITSPSILLDVDGVSGYGGELDDTSSPAGGSTSAFVETKGVRLGKDSAGGQSAPIEFMASHWGVGYGFKVQNVDTGGGTDLIFYSRRSTSSWSEQMRITDDGKVGIGGVNPSEALEVSGNGTISGNLTVSGNLTISGTTTTVDTTNLEVKDNNITLNYSSGDSSSTANNSGIIIQDAVDSSTDASILWDATNDEFDFSHSVTIDGSLSATTKSFDIEHPTKKGMRLHHGSLEGPEHGVYHRGVGTSNVVELPDYWTGLVDEDTITVQLTPRGSFQQLFVRKVEGNRVHVDSTGDGDLSFYYNIYGTRKDVGKMEVEY